MASPVQTTIAPGRVEVPARPGISRTDALLLCTALVWGVNYTVVKYGTTRLDPLAYNGARILIAIAIFGVMAVRRPGRRPIARSDVIALLALGLLGHGVYQYLFAEGIAHTRAGSAALVLAATPAFTAIIGRVLGIERIRRRGAAGIVLSVVGIATIVYGGARHQSGSPTLYGNVLILAGAVCWSVYTVLLKPFTARVSLVDLSVITLVGGGIPLVLYSIPAMVATSWMHAGWLTWGAIIYSAVGSMVLGYLFWYRGVRVLGPTSTAIYSNVQPVIALLASWALIAEVPTLWQGLGAATIIAGVLLTRS